MRKLSIFWWVGTGLLVPVLPLFSQTTVVEYPGPDWSFVQNTFDNASSTEYACPGPTPTCGSGATVFGPGTPPLGFAGSANLVAVPSSQVDSDNNPFANSSSLQTNIYNGTLVSSLTALMYSTYDTANNGQQFPYLSLNVQYLDANDHTYDTDTLFFEPPYQTFGASGNSTPGCAQGATVMNQWQTWNALAGCWWDNNNVASPGTPEGPNDPGVQTLDYILENEANAYGGDALSTATITGGTFDGGLEFTVGFADNVNYNGYVQGVVVGVNGSNTTYDSNPHPSLRRGR